MEERLACSSYTRTRIFHHARREGCQSCKGRTKAGGMYSSAFVKRNPALGLVGLHKRGIVFCAGWLRVRFLCRLWMRRQSQGSFAISPSHESRALQLTYCQASHVLPTYCPASHIFLRVSALFQLFSEEYSSLSGLRVIATPLFELVLAGRGTQAKSVLLNI